MSGLFAQFSRFVEVGFVATAAHYLALVVLVELFAAPVVVASTVGAFLGALVGYFLNRRLTFRSRVAHEKALPRYMAVAAMSLVLNGVLMALLGTIPFLPYLIAQAITTGALMVLNFVMNRFWSFKDHQPAEDMSD